jgi:hypothetical protein
MWNLSKHFRNVFCVRKHTRLLSNEMSLSRMILKVTQRKIMNQFSGKLTKSYDANNIFDNFILLYFTTETKQEIIKIF